MLLKPLLGQFEQNSNTHTIFALGLCRFMRVLDLDVIESWLQSERPDEIHFATDPNILIDWLMQKQWKDTQGLCSALWRQVKFSPAVIHRLSHLHS